jgi:hypothetical protein
MLTSELVTELGADHQPPCLSLYQPTHRCHPENQQDSIRFRNLVKELGTSLRQKYPTAETRLLLEPFDVLADEHDFWNHTLDGLAVLGGPGLFHVFRLQRPVAELVVVADSFHTKPLRRLQQSVNRYQVLGLSLHKIQLFEGTRDALDEIDPASGVPRTITEALGDELSEPHSTVASYGGVGQGSTPMHHGQGGKKDEVDIDADRFFRTIDRAVLESHSQPTGLPLMRRRFLDFALTISSNASHKWGMPVGGRRGLSKSSPPSRSRPRRRFSFADELFSCGSGLSRDG